MIGPYAQQTDLQIIGVFKHKLAGDTYISAMKDFDDKLSGLLSSLRNRGEFVGELGETVLFKPPTGSIVPARVLVIGLGPESDLSLDTLRWSAGWRWREAVRLKAKHVSFPPTIRDQGNNAIDVGQGDRAVVENMILAYDTEKRLQA
jgi:Cytosol aminopeptidase family, N-terminal domain